jgi:hypothetical protein
VKRLLPLLLLCACTPDAPSSGTISAEEDRQLNEAAASLDANAYDDSGDEE